MGNNVNIVDIYISFSIYCWMEFREELMNLIIFILWEAAASLTMNLQLMQQLLVSLIFSLLENIFFWEVAECLMGGTNAPWAGITPLGNGPVMN